MKILSPAFQNNQTIPTIYTCDGENINPPLVFQGIPEEAKSLVLTVDDPDSPTKEWTHWIVYNISQTTTKVEENSVPQGGIQGLNSFGNAEYGGPCPHAGTHRYYFKLFVLDTDLPLPENTVKTSVEKAMEGRILESAELIGLYKR